MTVSSREIFEYMLTPYCSHVRLSRGPELRYYVAQRLEMLAT